MNLSAGKTPAFKRQGNRQALRDVCMVFQQFNLWPHMTVLDNATRCGGLKGLP
jgi:polar amino acid transport system ATP-binding protein